MDKNVSLKMLVISHIIAFSFLIFAVFGFPRILLSSQDSRNSIRPMKMSKDLETVFYGFGNHDSTRINVFDYNVDTKKYPNLSMNLEMFKDRKWTVVKKLSDGGGYDEKSPGKINGTIGIQYSPEEGGFFFLDGVTGTIPSVTIPQNYSNSGSINIVKEEKISKDKKCLMVWAYDPADDSTTYMPIPTSSDMSDYIRCYTDKESQDVNKNTILIAVTANFHK